MGGTSKRTATVSPVRSGGVVRVRAQHERRGWSCGVHITASLGRDRPSRAGTGRMLQFAAGRIMVRPEYSRGVPVLSRVWWWVCRWISGIMALPCGQMSGSDQPSHVEMIASFRRERTLHRSSVVDLRSTRRASRPRRYVAS
jgi:hypothetical protein